MHAFSGIFACRTLRHIARFYETWRLLRQQPALPMATAARWLCASCAIWR